MTDNTNNSTKKRLNRGLVIPCGAARGAYHVGFLKGVREISKDLSPSLPFESLVGISAGAITVAALAAWADDFAKGLDFLENNLRSMTLESVLKLDPVRLAGGILPTKNSKKGEKPKRYEGGLFDLGIIAENVHHKIDYARIQQNIEAGHLQSVSVTATHVKTGQSVSFFQSDQEHVPWKRYRRIGVKTQLAAEHVLASCAIPAIFPYVQIDGRYYCDGGVRNHAPLSPALHLGTERMLVINCSQDKGFDETIPEAEEPPPTTQIGALILSMMSDGISMDLERINSVNEKIGKVGVGAMNNELYDFKTIQILNIRPTHDFGAIALSFQDRMPKHLQVMFGVRGSKTNTSGNLLSYLLFHKDYLSTLIDLGHADALKMRNEILNILT